MFKHSSTSFGRKYLQVICNWTFDNALWRGGNDERNRLIISLEKKKTWDNCNTSLNKIQCHMEPVRTQTKCMWLVSSGFKKTWMIKLWYVLILHFIHWRRGTIFHWLTEYLRKTVLNHLWMIFYTQGKIAQVNELAVIKCILFNNKAMF